MSYIIKENKTTVIENVTVTVDVTGSPSNNLTVSLKDKDGNNHSTNNKAIVPFKNTSDGQYSNIEISSALSLTLPDSTLGIGPSETLYLYIYLIKNGSNVELALSESHFPDNSIQSSIAAVSNSNTMGLLHSTTELSNKPARLISVIEISKSSGFWLAPSLIQVPPAVTHRVVSCILKQNSGVWTFLNTSNHRSLGVASVNDHASSPTINYAFTAKRVVHFSITSDNTYASAGIVAGSTVGVTSATLSFSAKSFEVSGLVSYNGSSWVISNPTSGLDYTSFTSGDLVLGHNTLSRSSISITPANATYRYIVTNAGTSSTTINIYNLSGTKITTPDTNMSFYIVRSSNGLGRYTATSDDIDIGGVFFCNGLFEV